MMHNLTIAEQIIGLKNRDFSSLELTQHYLNRINDSELNAFISITKEHAINQAKLADSIFGQRECDKADWYSLCPQRYILYKGYKNKCWLKNA